MIAIILGFLLCYRLFLFILFLLINKNYKIILCFMCLYLCFVIACYTMNLLKKEGIQNVK